MVPSQPEELSLWAESRIDGGMVTEYDPVDLELKELTLASNVQSRDTETYVRNGHTLLTPTKPDSDAILKLARYREFDGTERYVRFTADSLHLRSSSWVSITGAALNAGDDNLITPVTANNQFFFGNEVDPLQEIDFSTLTYAPAGNAKRYKYYVPFYNRIVGANLNIAGSENPIEVGWSGDLNFTEWDPLNDISAGFGPLIDNPADSADFISGLRVVSDVMLVIRQYSIWTATRVPSATSPFYFANASPNYGCNAPGSLASIPNGIAYYDERLNNVFAYVAGQREPEKIGDKIKNTIRDLMVTPESLRGSYDPVLNQYKLLIPDPDNGIATVATYDFGSQSWVLMEIALGTCIDNADFVVNSFTINDLVGPINGLVGTINGLSPSSARSTVFIGRSDGEILAENPAATDDAGTSFTVDVRSKLFKLPAIVSYVAQLHIEYTPYTEGEFTINYSKDGGTTFTAYKTVTFTAQDVGKRLTAVCNKNIRARDFMWQITSEDCQYSILEYSAYVFSPAGYVRQKTS